MISEKNDSINTCLSIKSRVRKANIVRSSHETSITIEFSIKRGKKRLHSSSENALQADVSNN